ncbi:7tm 6 domain containing protein [Asbolus verrucosus]|uniref:Odorant receptor n=1 Tax=Asbolus verrucosus TaxID=1661398 RepID=A0A482WA50_ASBVE|nr:7tm 6 domain containing protein [Asbolus verrucosus]
MSETIMNGLVLYNFHYMDYSISEAVDTFEGVSTLGHILLRKISVVSQATQLEDLYNQRLRFWKYDMFGKEKGDKYRKRMTICAYLSRGLLIVTFTTAVFLGIRPIFVESKTLPEPLFVPGNNKFLKIFFYVAEMFYLCELILLTSFYDGTFLMMCGELEIQFQILKMAIRSIKIGEDSTLEHEETCCNQLKSCSLYHLFLKKVHHNLNKTFSIFVVFQYGVSVVGICINLFILNSEESTLTQKMTAIMYMQPVSLQLAFIFIPASNVGIESESLADAIFDVDWYNAKNMKMRKHILFMITNALEPLGFTGAGLFDINRTVFLQILRISFSIFTLLRQTTK